jgi:alkylated DNA repair dioxygenase AlkB
MTLVMRLQQRLNVSDEGPSNTNPNVSYLPGFFPPGESRLLFDLLSDEACIAWRQDVIRIAGRRIPIPRLNAWYGDTGADYSYSGIRLEALPWVEPLQEIRKRVEWAAGVSFNSVLLNYYRDENDSVSWHADDEPELGTDPIIASVSLGQARSFELRRKRKQERQNKLQLLLEDGSLLVMGARVGTPIAERACVHGAAHQPHLPADRA